LAQFRRFAECDDFSFINADRDRKDTIAVDTRRNTNTDIANPMHFRFDKRGYGQDTVFIGENGSDER
jgi:hypothetical protein